MTTSDAATGFRERILTLIDASGLNQAGFARMAGIDRSTLSQLLLADGARMPRAETLIALASSCQVSADWLLGLSTRKETGTEIIESVMQIQRHTRSPVDDHFVHWLAEVEGYRVRTVPDSIPDFLKTDEVLRFEYQGASFDIASQSFGARLALMRRPDSELDVCTSIQALTTLAKAEGKWEGLALPVRRRQLAHFRTLYAELYPKLRIYFYTLSETYTPPFTIFGQKRVTLFLGTNYLVLNDLDYIRFFGRRFDELIRLAVVQPHQIAEVIDDLLGELG
ncbi:helix-turn-helix domain-containing protein [Paracoccus aminophilus]|uniref:HTH cro/C1-type domain-containing protein n=1 Tax=Paracoccus aminophilus JCM 7686 TaxID=1367847 RepID=S5YUK7_PARAH|nr:helix-turn-helix transcriptional regulator [Paracoccus aminophilus]AGT08921.1 hypothetical protein JCM7686_1820 [Paracoccus aminophilus JCM 7686]